MSSRIRFAGTVFFASLFLAGSTQAVQGAQSEMRFIQVQAADKFERSRIVDSGMSIEFTRSDSVGGFATQSAVDRMEKAGFRILSNQDSAVGRGGHESQDFPGPDSRFHNFAEVRAALADMQAKNPDIAKVHVIGKSIEGRDILAIHINTSPDAIQQGGSNKPGAIFMGNHHAREHLSVEIPLMLAQYLLDHRADAPIWGLLDSRDLWIVPMVNPDGAEYDISTSRYQWWRKNRKNNGDGTYGVDLNRNYGYMWGTGGSDKETSSDIYMGTAPFSEPESQAIRDFVEAHLNAKVLLSFHTFSELVLYPWGHKFDPISTARDREVFEKMAKTMAGWNHYKPEQSSDLYIASGDTTDWAYGAHGIFAFTFELSPRDMMDGGFYPGANVIDRVFAANIRPCLYMIDLADDPYKVLGSTPTGYLRSYVEPAISPELMWESSSSIR